MLVSGGGTGGHVYPALVVISALSSAAKGADETKAIYVGSKHGMERELVLRTGLDFTGIQAGPIRGHSVFETAANIGRLGIGLVESLRLIGQQKPKAILATGGYVCVPVVVAGWLRGIPSLIFLPDVRPGWAIRFLSRFAKTIAATSARSKEFLPPDKVVETGYPVRSEILQRDKVEGRQRLGLRNDLPVLLALGGSRGAHSINVAVQKALSNLLPLCQIMHVCGHDDEPGLRAIRDGLDEDLRQRYHLYPYLHEEMMDALAAADLVVSRSGASVMGDYPAAGLPSILVPYPYAGGHQRLNARLLVEAGATVMLENDQLDQLASLVTELFSDRPRLLEMAAKARRLARPDAAQRIARILVEIGAAGRAAD